MHRVRFLIVLSLLIGALLGYLAATGAPARHRRQIWAGVVAGIAATLLTWAAASALIPINGANRELIEGATAQDKADTLVDKLIEEKVL